MAMSYKGKLYIGTAGSQAATLVTNCQDVDYTVTITKGDTTERGDGSAPPIETEQVTARKPQITIKIREKNGDTNLLALKAAALTGGPIAVRYLYETGSLGFDGDMTFELKNTQALKDTQVNEFSGTATVESGRTPILNG